MGIVRPAVDRAPARTAAGLPVQVIEPRGPGLAAPVREGWSQRWLVPYFGHMLLEKLYVRTWLGWLWLPLRPALDLAVRVAVLGSLLGSPSPGGVPYILYALLGLTFWQLFDQTASWAARSMEVCRPVLNRIYVARITVVMGGLWPGLVYFGLYAATWALAAGWFLLADGTAHLVLGAHTLWLAVAFTGIAGLALGTGLFLAPLNALARDIRFALNYALGAWFFITPILYPLDRLDGLLRDLAVANPVTAPIELAKHALFQTGYPEATSIATFAGSLAVLVVGGLLFFNRSEIAAVDRL